MQENAHFSANQLRFIDWLAATKYDRKPLTQLMFANEIGVNESTLVRWKKLPGFKEAVTKRARELLGDDLPEIYGALRREAMHGSFQHIKLALELSGEYVETTKQEHAGGLRIEYVNDWRGNTDTDN